MLAQWRELNSIFKKQDKHILINFVYDYPKEHLVAYSNLIINEFYEREYNIRNLENYEKYFGETRYPINIKIKYIDIFENKMNNIYLRQCLYNLEEKAMCGGITKEEWQKIYNKYKDKFDLWKGE